MEEVHKRGNGVTCKACMATATASLKRKPRLPLKNPGLKEQYNTREVVVYGHRQTQKKTPTPQLKSPVVLT